MHLQGEKGAVQVISAYAAMNSAAFLQGTNYAIVTDIDTLADLQRAEHLLAAHQQLQRI